MRTTYITAVLALCAGALPAQQRTAARPPTAVASPGDSLRLTRAEAIGAALKANPQLDVLREQWLQARARHVSAVALPDPTFTYSLDDEPRVLQLGKAGSKNAELGFEIPFPDKLRLRGSIASADVRSADYRYTQAKQQVAAEASKAYDALLATRRRGRDLIEGRALADSVVRRAQSRFDAGFVPRLDVIKARVDLAQADNDIIANSRDLANAEAALNRLMGIPLGTPIAQNDSLGIPRDLPSLEVLERAAYDSRPDLRDLNAQRAGQRANTNLLKEYWLPDFTLGASHDYKTPGSPGYSAGLGVSLPLFFWQHSKGDVAESQHRERELEASYRDLSAAVGQDVRAAYASAATALQQAVFIRDELLPAARESFRAVSVAYSLGGASSLEVIDARRTLLDAQQQYSEALANANSARADLEFAVGRPLDSFLAVPGGSRE